MNILFVCSANKDRSRTAEDYFREQYPNHDFESAGTNKKICEQLGTTYLSKELLYWADKIFVMENKHGDWIRSNSIKKLNISIHVLKIQDVYEYGQKELIEELIKKVSPWLE